MTRDGEGRRREGGETHVDQTAKEVDVGRELPRDEVIVREGSVAKDEGSFEQLVLTGNSEDIVGDSVGAQRVSKYSRRRERGKGGGEKRVFTRFSKEGTYFWMILLRGSVVTYTLCPKPLRTASFLLTRLRNCRGGVSEAGGSGKAEKTHGRDVLRLSDVDEHADDSLVGSLCSGRSVSRRKTKEKGGNETNAVKGTVKSGATGADGRVGVDEGGADLKDGCGRGVHLVL